MNKSDLKDWTRDMLETEIINMNAKNFHLQSEVNNLRESNGRLQSQLESLQIQMKEKKHENNYFGDGRKNKKEDVDELKKIKQNYIDIISKLVNSFDLPLRLHLLDGHGYYYKNSGDRFIGQIYFTDGIGFHDGTGKSVELR